MDVPDAEPPEAERRPQEGPVAEDEVTGARFRARRVDGYVHIDHVDGASLDLQDALEELASIETLGDGGPMPALVDIRGLRAVTRDARKAFADSTVCARLAMLVHTSLTRTIATFFIGVANPDIPAKVFTDLEDAVHWLVDHDG